MKLRKLLAMVLALALVLSGSVMAFAADDDPEDKMANDGRYYSGKDIAVLTKIIEDHWSELPSTTKEVVGTSSSSAEWKEDWFVNLANFVYGSPSIYVSWESQGDVYRIIEINCNSADLTDTLDVSGLDAMTQLHLNYNALTALDVSGCTSLEILGLADNQLTTLNVSGLTNLRELFASNNELTSLDVSGCTSLELLDCADNQLATLNATGCKSLEKAYVQRNKLTSLDLYSSTGLKILDCRYNDLTEIKVGLGFEVAAQGGWDRGEIVDDNLSSSTTQAYMFTPQNDGSGIATSGTTGGNTDGSTEGSTNNGTTGGNNGGTTGGNNNGGNNNGSGNNNTGSGNNSAAAQQKESTRDSVSESNHQAEEAAMNAVESAMEAIQSGAASTAKLQSVTTASGSAISAVSVKLYGMSASLSIDSMETMAGASVGLNVSLDNGAAEVLIPGGFALANDPGRVYYPLGFQKDPYGADTMRSLVRGADAKTEVYKVGGGTLPTTASVTLKTKLTGTVNIYCWNEETRRVTLLGTATAQNGKVSFATKQLGNLIITTGTI